MPPCVLIYCLLNTTVSNVTKLLDIGTIFSKNIAGGKSRSVAVRNRVNGLSFQIIMITQILILFFTHCHCPNFLTHLTYTKLRRRLQAPGIKGLKDVKYNMEIGS